MNASTPTPHDAVFKQFLTRTETARDFLEIHLPPALLARCDLKTLKLESGSFIERELRGIQSDILYSLQTDSGEGYIYCLIEHQSKPDRLMTFRLMRYALAAMQRHLDNNRKKKELPLVIPVLFYHGRDSPYPHSMNWLDAFSDAESARQLYCGHFPLVDVTVISDDDIIRHRRVAALELVQKHIRQRDIAELEPHLVMLLQLDYTTPEQLEALFSYMLMAGDTENPGLLISSLAQSLPQHEEILMTIAQKLQDKARKEGMLLGEQKGRQAERLETKLEIARKMLANGMDHNTVMTMTGLTQDDVELFCH
ncbi:Rpn family recombination-promoting nuclease/putative transposase [Erwiniaceae bacterium BAC15a-03b]|uniref:Rpn family recombination-promoting nuclease/putative transposase n=1 Tax=Winslowiella arboricola TaxID=2978220 RepID=A0A9J6PTN8_9GAMM|nr:Rpn family recombination-promoting nuclease/putative transposase [Winslowiella arboricola]MCU5772531.1 Rpn family recombination-promoting nuclease/putative transposase [Winslowiella arboricola]MCU5779053.1 Rpn family recombination-promoting nuclease/putative transposase [Winslowiella arboricola]